MHCTTSTLLCIWREYFIVWYTYSCHPDVLYIAQHSLYICNRAHECVWNQSFSKHTVDYSDIIYTCMLYTETHDLKLLLWHPAMRINWSAWLPTTCNIRYKLIHILLKLRWMYRLYVYTNIAIEIYMKYEMWPCCRDESQAAGRRYITKWNTHMKYAQ